MEITHIFIFSLTTFMVFGLLFGSFATMASYRIPRGEDLVIKSSHCPSCKHKLKWFDLFPLLSWLFNLGKCRYCKAKIGIRYPAVALVITITALVIAIVITLGKNTIPNSFFIALIIIGLLYRFSVGAHIYEYLPGAIVAIAIASAIRHVLVTNKKPEYLTLIEVKFIGIAGLFVGFKGLIPLILISGIITFIIYLPKKILRKSYKIQLVPSIILAIFICTVFHKYTIDFFSFLN
ncbi:MAG: Prepilin peptidase [Rickettsiaceae bacterium]|nr:Prepilin peptidase [Rickettsiaceae bacterium]